MSRPKFCSGGGLGLEVVGLGFRVYGGDSGVRSILLEPLNHMGFQVLNL